MTQKTCDDALGLEANTQNGGRIRHCPVCGLSGGVSWSRGSDWFHGGGQSYDLVRCPSCSFVWLENAPSPTEMSDHYGADYDSFISRAGGASERWRFRRETLLQYKSQGVLLDLGCSSGAFLETLKDQHWELHGLEISAVPARIAEARSGARVFVGDISDADFSPCSFDAITCFDVLEHLYDPRLVMAKVAKWLKLGGIFYLLVPNVDSGEARVFKSYWYGLELPRHLSHFSPKSLNHLAQVAGLEEVSLTTHSNSTLEYSIRYYVDDLIRKFGLSRTPLAKAKPLGIPRRIVRKMRRMTILPMLRKGLSLAGPGESVHAVFRKSIT